MSMELFLLHNLCLKNMICGCARINKLCHDFSILWSHRFQKYSAILNLLSNYGVQSRRCIKLESMRVLVIDEVDFMFGSNQVSSLRKLLTSYSSINTRQTVFASASIPQHRRFLHDCIQQKWTKNDAIHIHVNPVQPMPKCIHHRFVISGKNRSHETLLSLLQSDEVQSGIILVGEQSEKSKKAGNPS